MSLSDRQSRDGPRNTAAGAGTEQVWNLTTHLMRWVG
jgi:hypothetical protein